RGVLALELLWELDARRANAQHVDAHHCGGAQGRLVLRTAQPTQDMAHLQRLLAEQLARVTLPAPVLYLRLRSLQTQALAGESASLLPDDVRQGDSLHQLLERLSARLGPQQVRCATAQADHRPEQMQHWQAAASAVHTKAGGIKEAENAALYPTWLLPVPQRLAVQHGSPQYQGPLTLLAGPQRLEAGWLEGEAHCALRDYFVACSAVAGLVWVYRERLAGQGDGWYLHGLFA
ncbi:MAG: DNA polymerase Y family protein, partial [Rhodoferax sp.]